MASRIFAGIIYLLVPPQSSVDTSKKLSFSAISSPSNTSVTSVTTTNNSNSSNESENRVILLQFKDALILEPKMMAFLEGYQPGTKEIREVRNEKYNDLYLLQFLFIALYLLRISCILISRIPQYVFCTQKQKIILNLYYRVMRCRQLLGR